MDKPLHRHIALLETRIISHAFANSAQIIVPIDAEELVAIQVIQQERVHAHLIEFPHRAGRQCSVLLGCQLKFAENFFRFLFHPFAKGRIVIGEIQQLIDLIHAHVAPRFR